MALAYECASFKLLSSFDWFIEHKAQKRAKVKELELELEREEERRTANIRKLYLCFMFYSYSYMSDAIRIVSHSGAMFIILVIDHLPCFCSFWKETLCFPLQRMTSTSLRTEQKNVSTNKCDESIQLVSWFIQLLFPNQWKTIAIVPHSVRFFSSGSIYEIYLELSLLGIRNRVWCVSCNHRFFDELKLSIKPKRLW